MISNAGKDIQNLPLLPLSILRALSRQQREMETSRQFNCRLVAEFLRAIVVTLQLDIHISAAINRDQLLEQLAAGLNASLVKSMRQRTLVSSREANESVSLFRQIRGRGNDLSVQQGVFT